MGYGFLVSNEQAGAGALSRFQFMGQAAHNLRLNRKLNLRSGMQLGFGARSIDFDNLVFTDQLLRDNAAMSVETPTDRGRNYLDMGAGFMLLSRRTWLGMSANHLLSPNASLNPTLPEKLAVLYTVHGGARIQLVHGPKGRLSRDLVWSWKYVQQGDRNQLDMGAYYDLSVMTLGVWYRGIPVQKAPDGSIGCGRVELCVWLWKPRPQNGIQLRRGIEPIGGAWLSWIARNQFEIPVGCGASTRSTSSLPPMRGILRKASGLQSYLIDLGFQAHAKGGLHRCHDVLGQGPHLFTRCATVVHKHEGLPVMHAMCFATVPFPSRLFNEPAGGQFDLA